MRFIHKLSAVNRFRTLFSQLLDLFSRVEFEHILCKDLQTFAKRRHTTGQPLFDGGWRFGSF